MGYALYTSATDSIGLDVERDFKDDKALIINFHETLGGERGEYQFGFFLNWEFTVNFLTSSEASAINDWYFNATDLTFALDSGSSYTVRISNNSQPVKSAVMPYHNELNCNIKLTEVY